MNAGSDPRRTALIAAVAATGAVALIGLSAAYRITADAATLRKALLLVALSAVAELVAIRVRHGDSGELLTLFELAVVADIALLPPALAAFTAVGGLGVALAVHRRPPVKFAFNLGQYALGVVPAVVLYHGIGNGDFFHWRGLVGMFVGMTVFTAVNLVTISAIIGVTTARPVRKVLAEERGLSIAIGLGNSAVGMVAVSLYLTRPALLPALLAPVVALHMAFKGWVEQKELSGLMEEEKSKLGRILEHSSEGIVLAAADGSVVLWSPSMEKITGVPAAEAEGKSLSYLLRGRNQWGQPVTIDASREADPVELEVIAADGSVRWMRVQHGPGFDARGALQFDVLVVTDVTRQRELDQLKDDFVATVSHELRTPLTPIKGYASLLLRRWDEIAPERRKEALESILERSDHMARLVEDLLLASRVSGERERRLPEVARQQVDLGQIVEKALRPFRPAHPMREFRLHAPEAVTAMGDAIRIEQIVASLVSNAIKYSEEGAPVYITLERSQTEARIDVRDEGRGIPIDRIEEVFEKFRRLESSLRMETGGVGIGLFIVRQLVTAMGGRIEVASEVGKGSTFTVVLPTGGTPAAQPRTRTSDLAV